MNYDPGKYDDMAADTIEPARKLVATLEEKLFALGKTRSDSLIIVDIGCGPGNTARLLLETFTHSTIVGLDIDEQMIDFACKKNADCAQLVFLTQDIGQPWSVLSAKVQNYLGRIDAVFSNYACQWIHDTDNLARNVWQLLRPSGGVFCSALCYDGDLAHVADSPEQAARLLQACPYPSERRFIDNFLFSFKTAGFWSFGLDYEEPVSWFAEDFYRQDFVNIPLGWYHGFCTSEAAWRTVDELVRELHFRHRIRRTVVDESGVRRCEISQNLWTFIAHRAQPN